MIVKAKIYFSLSPKIALTENIFYLCNMNGMNLSELNNAALVKELGTRFKQYRINYRLTQEQVAEQAGMSVVTLRNFENGKLYNLTLVNFLALIRVLHRLDKVDDLLPEIPISAYEMEKILNRRPKRIKNGK